MQRLVWAVLTITALLLTGISLTSIQAVPLAYDPGNYPAGAPLDGLHGGYGWRTLWSGTNTVAEPGLEFSSLRTSGRAFSTIGFDRPSFRGLFVDGLDSLTTGGKFGREGTTLWLSFLFRRDRLAGGGEWAGLSLFNDGTEELFVGAPIGQNVLGLHIWDFGAAPGGLTLSTTRIRDGTVYFLVVRLAFGVSGQKDLVELYVNPEPGIEPGIPAASRSGADIRFNWIRINSGYSNTRATMDEIRIGTEYKDVAPGIALPMSQPKLESVRFDSSRRFSSTLRLESGYTYRVQSTTDFTNWTTLTDFISFSPEFRFQTPANQPDSPLFFRIVAP